MTDTYEKLHGQIDIANKYELLEKYVEEKGLLDDYDEWFEDKTPEEEKTTEDKEVDERNKKNDRVRDEDIDLF